MYRIQKIRSRKSIHNVSHKYKQTLIHAIHTARRENINNRVEVPFKSTTDSEENNLLHSIEQKQQYNKNNNNNVESGTSFCDKSEEDIREEITEDIHVEFKQDNTVCDLSGENICEEVEELDKPISFEEQLAFIFIQGNLTLDQCNFKIT